MTDAEQQDAEGTEDAGWYHELAVNGRRWPWWGWIPVGAVLIGVFIWWALNPKELPHQDGQIEISVKAGQTAYVGLIGRDNAGEEREIDVREVEFNTSGGELDIEAMICRNGAIGSTTNPDQFCSEVVEAEGALVLGGNDQLIAAITGSEPGTITVEDAEISYRDGLQFGSSSTGPSITVFVVG